MQGNGYIVSWCVGHLVELADASAYGEYKKWRREDLPILPDKWLYTVRPDKKKQLAVLKQLLHRTDVTEVINACDAGREGQLIFARVYEYCGCRKPILRLWISSMEESAIREGFENLRPGADYDNLTAAAHCRSQADFLVGINMSRLFSVLYGTSLNVGRVVTPTLALLTQREADISAFVREPFYTVELDCGGSLRERVELHMNSRSCSFTFTAASERMQSKAAAGDIRAACDGQPATVRTVERQQKTASPPLLYDLTALQQDANRLLGFTVQQTLDYAQSLYEKRVLSYPRTDSSFLTEDMRSTVGSVVNWLQINIPFAQGIPFAPDMARVIDGSKISDHHALIPTMEVAKADLADLPSGERDVLMLVAVRLLCATAPEHIFETVIATVDCAGNTFTAKGKTVLHDGWKAIDRTFRAGLKEKPEDAEENSAATLPELTEGQAFEAVRAAVKEGFTSPPSHHSEASLLGTMESAGACDMPDEAERRGLGTPSTRAATLEKLVRSGFVERKKRQLLPVTKGIHLIAVLPEAVKSPELTANWEHRLKLVEKGELSAADFMAGIADLVKSLVREHTAPDAAHAALFAAPKGEIVGQCPRCGMAVHAVAKGFFCADRACGFALWKDNRFFTAKKKTLDKKTAAALLSEGRVFFSDLFSPKTGKTYAATTLLDDDGQRVNFKLDFSGRKSK